MARARSSGLRPVPKRTPPTSGPECCASRLLARRAGKNEQAHARGKLESKLLGDHPAHRRADHAGAIDALGIKDRRVIGSHHDD
jgi:hypothetical protein